MYEIIESAFLNHPFLYSYFALINALTFFIFGIDKSFAFSNTYRVSEKALLFGALIGGSLGALGGVFFFRHKTRKNTFLLPLLAIVLVHLAIGWWLLGGAATLDIELTP